MLSVRNITAGYDEHIVVEHVSFDVASGEFVGLIGPNGCGKTTLLRVISGVLPAKSGSVLVQGVPLEKLGRRQLARIMACLSQDLTLDLAFTVREITLMGRSPHLATFGRETQQDCEITERSMALADVSGLADRLVTEISGGERQRALIAMCLAQEPQVFLLDEPTSHLDIGHQLAILDLIRDLNRQTGMTVVAVFHDLNLASEYCDRLVVLHQGQVEALGPPDAVLTANMVSRVYGANVLAQLNPVSCRPHIVVSAGSNRRSHGMNGAISPCTGLQCKAKTIAFQDLDVRSSYNPDIQATGTGTDSVMVISGRDSEISYVGGHAKTGEIMAHAVISAMKDAILKTQRG